MKLPLSTPKVQKNVRNIKINANYPVYITVSIQDKENGNFVTPHATVRTGMDKAEERVGFDNMLDSFIFSIFRIRISKRHLHHKQCHIKAIIKRRKQCLFQFPLLLQLIRAQIYTTRFFKIIKRTQLYHKKRV